MKGKSSYRIASGLTGKSVLTVGGGSITLTPVGGITNVGAINVRKFRFVCTPRGCSVVGQPNGGVV